MDMEIIYIVLFFLTQTSCSAVQPPSYWMDTGVFPQWWSPWAWSFMTQFHLVPRYTSVLALYIFMACAGTTIFSPFAMRDATSENFVNYLIILLLKSNQNTRVSRWFSLCREKYS